MLGWTGLRDTEGVPIAYYFLSLVSVREAATNNGQEISAFDPTSWAPWMAAAMERAVDNATAAWWLGMFSGAFIFVIAVSLWLLRFALSTGWLLAIATLGQPLYNAVSAYVNQMMLAAIAVTICAIIGGYHVLRGEPGRGWAMVGTAIILTVLLATVFTDPIGIFTAMTACLRWGAAQVWRLRRAPPVHLLPRARLWMPSSTPCCPTSSPQAFDIRCRSLTSGWSSMISADAVKPGAAR